ncbi:hypothetical protein HK413_12810 [Mucilaginibacter sp. S1162]|uniref:Glucose/Sorbosone dehydrogenase domain-containing protein n=1 Tax=Mucilaginibacter humi TaxID=2732510 RepID=A0ABX1W4X0_9SPHI|nr:PQQ-dependent sugar dehydrogenase [Mucilaginibacter humi]NNU34716.1 hypothetical protein [Mucilaginibacter humi]
MAPTALVFPTVNTGWVAEQTGKIRLIRDGQLTDAVVLDTKSKMVRINSGYEEKGLLNIALHPKFSANGKFYLFTADLPLHKTRLTTANSIIPMW